MASIRFEHLWASPNTVLGLLLAGLVRLTGGEVRIIEGVLEAQGGLPAAGLRRILPRDGGVAAIALGHVVVGRDRGCLERTRCHERVHVRHAEVWGPAFLPAYFLAGAWAGLRGRRPYLDNPFERSAREAEARIPKGGTA